MPHLKKSLLLSLAALSFVTHAEEWPKYRGPKSDGIVRDEKLATEWPAAGPTKLWTIKVGIGHASPIAADGKLYLFTRDEDQNIEVLESYNADTGEKLWSQSAKGGYTHNNKDWRGTRATPVIDADKIYTYGGSGNLTCRSLADGKEVWSADILKETSAKPIEWGEASSPLVTDDLVYVQGGRGKGVPVTVAVNKADGKLVWQSEAKGEATGKAGWPTGGGYAEPLLIDIGGVKQLIILAGTEVVGMEPKSGKTLWHEAWVTDYDVNATMPIYQAPNLFISSGYKHGSMMLEVSQTGAKKLWESPDFQSRYQGVIFDRGFLYGNSEGVIKCLHWPDGKVAWEEKAKDSSDRMGPGGSLVRFNDHMITLSELGKLTLAKVTPEGFTRLSSVKITKGSNIWATPLVYHGKLYVKGVSELICLDVAAK